jgi:protein-S-isoprenylcysteine O-methyltransferase Ste14
MEAKRAVMKGIMVSIVMLAFMMAVFFSSAGRMRALGSLYALIPFTLYAVLFTFRTYLEDKTLQEELPGYKEYTKKVKYRLIPGIW